MGYLHVNNLYKEQDLLMFKEVYALEKVHGTSAHLSYNNGRVGFFSGGESHEKFKVLFDEQKLATEFAALGMEKCIVYGEAYGGKQQGMSATYGKELKFIVFDVLVGEHSWLSVPDMHRVATALGLDVVPWQLVNCDLATLDRIRDMPSEVATRNGCGNDKTREGIVIRPPMELRKNNGARLIAKHKGTTFNERKTDQKIVDPTKLAVLTAAKAIADEWTTPMRLLHVLDKLPLPPGSTQHETQQIPDIIRAMVADIYREGAGEIVESKDAERAIGSRTAQIFKQHLQQTLKGTSAP